MNAAYALNTAWMWKSAGQRSSLMRATHRVADSQAEVLREILRRGKRSAYGCRYQMRGSWTPREFQQGLPIADYEDYQPFIHRVAMGEANVVTCDPIRLLEPTSGTTQGEKLIPYTKLLKRQFQRAVSAWIADLLRHRPAVRRGRAYWSISPALGPPRQSIGGIPIGFDDDTEYLGVLERRMAQRLLAVPSDVARRADIQDFRYATLLHLLQADDLALISVWSPTFLITLLECIEPWSDRICYDMHNLGCRRAHEIEMFLNGPSALPEKFERIWPQLALVSCWADAAATSYLPELHSLLPRVEIQPKGLLATEGCVSIPLVGEPGGVLALRSHFFEFLECDEIHSDFKDSRDCLLAHELRLGGRYQVLLTTGGGLYRYRLHDVVEVVGFVNECPLLRFVGKSNLVSDLVGEKVAETHVRSVIDRACERLGFQARFSLLVPVVGQPSCYRLYVQAHGLSPGTTERLRVAVQRGLEENPYYRHATEMHQLGELEIRRLDPTGEPGSLMYERVCIARGQKAGDIKYHALDIGTEWLEIFGKPTHAIDG